MTILDSKIIASVNNLSTLFHDATFATEYKKTVKLIVNGLKKGGRVYIAGNGGSSADSCHLAGELVCKIAKERKSLPAESLTADTALLTAIANDFGYEYVFSRQLDSKCTKKDVFLGITTSGNSKNIIEAFKVCKGKKILLTGRGGGEAKKHCDVALIVPGNTTDEIQEIHEIVYHSLVYEIEAALLLCK